MPSQSNPGSRPEHGAAMAADVQEGAQLPFAVERDDDRDVADASREVPGTVAQLAEMADVLPGPREDSLAFTRGQLGIGIGPPRERLGHADSLCRYLASAGTLCFTPLNERLAWRAG